MLRCLCASLALTVSVSAVAFAPPASAGATVVSGSGASGRGTVNGGAERSATPSFAVMTPASKVASRTDRRPVAGGVYDRAVNKTFISWAGKGQDSYVQAYDHASRTWSAPRKIIGGRSDTHNYPTMIQAADGHLLIFVGMHNVELVMARSPHPHSVDGTWTTRVIPQGPAASYPMPFKAANGNLFVFFRETTSKLVKGTPVDTRPLVYVRSTDHGRTWTSSKTLTGHPYTLGSTERFDNLNEVYMGQLRHSPASPGREERVDMVWTIAGGGPGKHAHAAILANVYYASFNPNNLHYYSASGQDLGTQLNNDDQEKHAKIATTPLKVPFVNFVQLVGVNGTDPFVIWHTHRGQQAVDAHMSTWTGRGWKTVNLGADLRPREMEPVGPGAWRVYTAQDDRPNITTYLARPGTGWLKESVISTPREPQRIELITGFRDPARILVTEDSSSRDVEVADGSIHVIGAAPTPR